SGRAARRKDRRPSAGRARSPPRARHRELTAPLVPAPVHVVPSPDASTAAPPTAPREGASRYSAWWARATTGRTLRGRRVVVAAALVPLLLLYIWGAMQQATRVNTYPNRTDQGAYLRFVKRMHATGFRYLGDRNRMPLYPGI